MRFIRAELERFPVMTSCFEHSCSAGKFWMCLQQVTIDSIQLQEKILNSQFPVTVRTVRTRTSSNTFSVSAGEKGVWSYLDPPRMPAPPTSTKSRPILQWCLWRGVREQGALTDECRSEERQKGGVRSRGGGSQRQTHPQARSTNSHHTQRDHRSISERHHGEEMAQAGRRWHQRCSKTRYKWEFFNLLKHTG